MADNNPIQVAGRLFSVFEYLADRDSAGLMEIAQALELNKSTAHRLLSSLQHMGYVIQSADMKYSLTMKVVEIAGKVMSRVDIISLVRPHLRNLMEETGETVHFVRRDGCDAVYIDKVESHQNSVQMVSHIGSRIPLFCSGVGKAIASTFDRDELRQLWKSSPVSALTPNTITDYIDFEDELSLVRRRGYALDNEENEMGVRCIAAGLCVPGKKAEYAISISAPVARMGDDRIEELASLMMEEVRAVIKEIKSVL
jgi:DNA-binding IclR family transcriptional regulator